MTTARDVLARNIAAVNEQDLNAYLANQHPDVEFVLPGGVVLHGREEVGRYTEMMWRAFPDGTLAFGQQAFDGDTVATEVVFSGTHTGPMIGPAGPVGATGKRVVVRSMSMLKVVDGLVASEHVYLDPMDLARQLGLAGQ